MNRETQKYHPAIIAVKLLSFFKGAIGGYLILFVLRASSTSPWVIGGRYLLLLITLWAIVANILKWHFHRYEISGSTIVFHEGILVRKQRTVALDRIHDHKSSSTFIHRWFGLTSLMLTTGISGADAVFEFPVISEAERKRIINCLEKKEQQDHPEHELHEEIRKTTTERSIHFRSTRRDMVKASFTSLNFLAIFPLLTAGYFNLAEYFNIELTTKHAVDYLLTHGWMLVILFIIALALSVGIGFIKTSIKYGNYTISDDRERIYIDRGVGQFVSYSILKHRVQAIIVEQSILKRILGLASIKIITAGGSIKDSEHETNSLYPFMPIHEAYRLLQTILPEYEIQEQMERFPINVLWIKLLQPYYLTLLAIAGLWIFKKEWLWMSAIVFGLSLLSRVLDYKFTSYLRHGEMVQIRKGGFKNETFVTHRKRIQQVSVKHTWLDRRFGVATLVISNKGKPFTMRELRGLPKEEAAFFYENYRNKSAL